jgi:hypothetical protein
MDGWEGVPAGMWRSTGLLGMLLALWRQGCVEERVLPALSSAGLKQTTAQPIPDSPGPSPAADVR